MNPKYSSIVTHDHNKIRLFRFSRLLSLTSESSDIPVPLDAINAEIRNKRNYVKRKLSI